MITKETYTLEYVNALREKYRKDPSLLERVLFAFGLLEAITRVGIHRTFVTLKNGLFIHKNSSKIVRHRINKGFAPDNHLK